MDFQIPLENLEHLDLSAALPSFVEDAANQIGISDTADFFAAASEDVDVSLDKETTQQLLGYYENFDSATDLVQIGGMAKSAIFDFDYSAKDILSDICLIAASEVRDEVVISQIEEEFESAEETEMEM